ncbi:NifU family protein [Arenibacter sp. GZD96]|uniref:NifU family protein n=1 Tax=Aurantibrevibacter litoralis TaxID=3106030 RepID=UPI002B00003C|nr:NifU family protein [Arenibacter sp. GZD-96]MEA1784607.1 NifU family protein [Arenibacter sp. GZD-96]
MEKEYSITLIPTSNPAIIKFETNQFITKNTSYEFKNIDEAKQSPLAQQLFYLPFVKTVYISANFIAIERFDIVAWEDVQDEVAQQLVEYLNAGEEVVIEGSSPQKKAITVYAEVTPNPAVMKFVTNQRLVVTGFEFKNIEDAADSALATALFQLPFVKEVFIDENYVSINKYNVTEWDDVIHEIRELIRHFVAEGNDVVAPDSVAHKQAITPVMQLQDATLDDTSKQIIDILEEYVKPAVASDGGNIMFKSYEAESKTVNVILQGACSGCPSSTFTLKNGIETMLKNMMGDKVSHVVALNG